MNTSWQRTILRHQFYQTIQLHLDRGCFIYNRNFIDRYEIFLHPIIIIYDLAKSRSGFKNSFQGVIRRRKNCGENINFNIRYFSSILTSFIRAILQSITNYSHFQLLQSPFLNCNIATLHLYSTYTSK